MARRRWTGLSLGYGGWPVQQIEIAERLSQPVQAVFEAGVKFLLLIALALRLPQRALFPLFARARRRCSLAWRIAPLSHTSHTAARPQFSPPPSFTRPRRRSKSPGSHSSQKSRWTFSSSLSASSNSALQPAPPQRARPAPSSSATSSPPSRAQSTLTTPSRTSSLSWRPSRRRRTLDRQRRSPRVLA